jgi:hypothetical protein
MSVMLQGERLGVSCYSSEDCIVKYLPLSRILQGSSQAARLAQVLQQLKTVFAPTVILTKVRAPDQLIEALKAPLGNFSSPSLHFIFEFKSE